MMSDELREFIEKFEKKQSEMEKQQNETISKMEKKMKELQMTNEKMLEELNKMKTVGNESSKTIEKPSYLSLLSLECIISYIAPNKRLIVSMCCSEFRAIEKSVPLEIRRLTLSSSSITINYVKYAFIHEKKRLHCIEKYNRDPVTIFQESTSPNLIQDTVAEVFFNVFKGRVNFRVEEFSNQVKLPYHHLDLRVEQITISRSCNLARDYCNFVETVDRVTFLDLCEPAELTYQWVRNVKQLEKISGDSSFFLEEFPNLLADKIYIQCDGIENCLDLIRSWSQDNNINNRKVGSQLFLTMVSETRAQELVKVDEILRSERLIEMGFVFVGPERFSLPMANGLEVRLTVDVDRFHFRGLYMQHAKFYRYFRIELVVDSESGP